MLMENARKQRKKKAAKSTKKHAGKRAKKYSLRRKAYSMSTVLSLIFLSGLFIVTFAFAFHYWQQGNYGVALWWALGAFVCFGVGITFALRPYALRRTEAIKPATASKPFSIAIVNGMGQEDRMLGSIAWLDYQSKFGDTLSPIHRTVFIRITNLQNVRCMIETYRVETQKPTGEWVKLTWMDGQKGSVYWIFADIKKSTLMEMEKLDAVLASRTIDPRQTVEGWAFFELPENISLKWPMRVYVKDFGGAEMTQSTTPQEPDSFGQGSSMTKIGVFDLTGRATVRYYSEAN